jgi:acetyl-CoA carboxylase biotin carboxyl carrier protein
MNDELQPVFEPIDPAPATAPDPASLDAPAEPVAVADGADASLLALVDRLAIILDRSDLTELEVEAGGTGLVLRKPAAVAPPVVLTPAVAPGSAAGSGSAAASTGQGPSGAAVAPARPSVKAPLTGLFYGSPAPGSAPYVQVGGEVAVGQVIGLIEAMKLFNEIKSDLAGRVVRIVAESGQLVKAKQPLIEVEPL